MIIRDKVAIVTGGGSGIGQAVARELACRGVSALALVDRSEAVNEVAGAVQRLDGVKVDAFVGDVNGGLYISRRDPHNTNQSPRRTDNQ